MNPQPEKCKVISGLQEALPVETIYQNEVISCPTIVHRALCDYLVLNGHTYTMYSETNKLTYGIASSFFTDPEDD